jgi:NADPH:quinone reductase-like Zn-dependent oxidoreductase
MKAIVWTRYGSPEGLQLKEVAKPFPKDNEVLIKIIASTVTAGDCEFRSLKLPIYFSLPLRMYIGVLFPKRITILGQEFSGIVKSVGKEVEHFKVGDSVFATTGFGMGGYAEYICMPETQNEMSGTLVHKPENCSYAEAAALPVGGLEALHFMRKAQIKKGDKILINGSGGSIGTIAVQLSKFYGAIVHCVDSSDKLSMLKSIGADLVFDYETQDFTKNGEKYDIIFDVVGKSKYFSSMQSLKKNGKYLLGNPKLFHIVLGKLSSLVSRKSVISGAASHNIDDLKYLKELIEKNIIKVVVDKHFPLEKTKEAHYYVESGLKKGNIVIDIDSILSKS